MSLERLIEMVPVNKCNPGEMVRPCFERLRDRVISFFADLGYEHIRIGWRKKGVPTDIVDAPAIFMSSVSKTFEAHYVEGAYLVDPLLRFTADVSAPDYLPYGEWSTAFSAAMDNPLGDTEAERNNYKKAVRDLFALCADHGMVSGVFMQFAQGSYLLSVSAATPRPDAVHKACIDDAFWRTLRMSLLCFSDIASSIDRCHRCSRRYPSFGVAKLAKQQQIILNAYLDRPGASLADISALTGFTKSNIKYHLSRMREMFNLRNTPGYQLAQYAHDQHLI